MSKNFKGTATYEIRPNGHLYGIYENDSPKTEGIQFIEMARKEESDANKDPLNFPEHIFGKYVCTYTTQGDFPIVTCDLEIRRVKGKRDNYKFVWSMEKIKGQHSKLFEGIGHRMGNRIDVTYSDI